MKLITSNLSKNFQDVKKGVPVTEVPFSTEVRDLGAQKPVLAYYNQIPGRTSLEGGYADLDHLLDYMDSPMLQASNLYLPYNRIELNAWLRYFDATHPLLGSIIDLHATYPFSRFEYTEVDDPKVREIYQAAHDKVKLFQRLLEMVREYWLMGEFIAFKSWDNSLGIWDSVHLLDPDDIQVDGDIIIDPEDLDYYWMPPESLKLLLNNMGPYSERMKKKLDPSVLTAIQTSTEVPLDKFSVSHVARRANPFQPRGLAIALRCMKSLMYEEDLVSAQRAIAKRHIFPLQIYKIGDITNNYIPLDSDLQAFRDVLTAVSADPNKAIIFHDALQVEFMGTSSQLLDIRSEFEVSENRILTGLFTNKAFVSGDNLPAFASASVAARMLSSRYITVRHLMEDFIRDDFCKPIAVAHDLYQSEKKATNAGYRVSKNWGRKHTSFSELKRENESFFLRNGKFEGSSIRYKGHWYKVEAREGDKVTLVVEDAKKLNLPAIKWGSKINLVDDMENKQILLDLYREGRIPFQIIADSLNLNPKEVERGLAAEKDTLLDPFVLQVLKGAAENQEYSPYLVDKFSEKVLHKAKERGIDLESLFPKLPEGEEGAGMLGASTDPTKLLGTPINNLPIEQKLEKLSRLSTLAGLDDKVKRAIKTVASNLAMENRLDAMVKDSNEIVSVKKQRESETSPEDG